jgi:hypothetical protein
MLKQVWQSLVVALLLVACTNPQLPFSKNLPSAGESQPSINPPWDALVQAAPGAENELDLETLDGPQQAVATPPPAAEPPPIPEIAAPPEIAEKQKSPPAKDAVAIRFVAVPMVKGAKGSGNAELTGVMRQVLADAGWPVLEKPQADALLIIGQVSMAPPSGASQVVKITWTAQTPKGKKLGEIAQENAVPAGSLDNLWGENAGYAAEAAAEGIFKLIQQFR